MAAPRQITEAGLLLLLLIVHEVSTGSQQVSVSLNAKWNSTPLMMEASEFLASEDHDLFWRFVNMIADTPYDNYEDQHDESMYDMALKFAGRLLSPLQINLLKFSLAMRAYSPTVQMHYQVALDKQAPENCELFVDVNNMITCEMGAFKAMLSLAKKQNKPSILKNDHHYPGSQNHDVTAILYADFTSKGFKEYHKELKKLAEDGEVNYILRHFVKNPVNKKVRLSGYGVELAIKNTEYKAKDDTKVEGEDSTGTKEKVDDEVEGFNFSKLKQLHPDMTDKLDEFRGHLVESAKEIPPLKVWQLQDLSFQAAQLVLSASPEDAMKVLRDISQNFPTKMRKVVKTTVKEAMRQEVKKNQRMLQEKFDMYPGDSALFINGLQADLDIYDVFTLLGTLQSEAKLLEGLSTLGIKGDQANNMLKLNTKQSESNYALDIRDKAVQWLNNLEKDKRYSGWPSSVQELLRPTFPGMLRHIRKNFFSLIFMIDPGDVANKELLKMAEAFYVHNAPVRVGVVLVPSTDTEAGEASVAMETACHYIASSETPSRLISFLNHVYERVGDDKLTAHFIMEEFESEFPEASINDVFSEKSKYAEARKDAAEFHQKTGLGAAPQVLLNGIPLSKSDLDSDNFEEAVVTMILKQTQDLQRAVYNGQLSDSTNIMDYVMTKPNVMPRLNSRILSEEGEYLDMTKTGASVSVKNAEAFRSLPPGDMTGAMISTLKYMTKKEEDKLRPITHWVISDLDTKQGRELLYAATKHLKHSQEGRIGIIHNPASVADESDKEAHYISRATQVAMETLSSGMSKSFITKLMKEENVEELIAGTKMLSDFEVHNMDTRSYERSLAGKTNEFLKVHAAFCEKALGFKPGERGVISNGRILGPLKSDEQFITEDFNLLEKQMIKGAASQIEKEVLAMALENEEGSDLVMRVAGLLMSVPHKETRKDVEFKAQEHSVVKIPPKRDGPSYDVVAILDPSTRAAQKYTPLIMVLQQVVNVNVKVFMNCREKLSEMPLKSFYRYVLEPEVTFAVDSSLASGPTGVFTDLPRKSLLTMNLDPPESWLVESVTAVYDLDNIVMEEVEGNLNAEFELEYLLLEGHCFDANTGQPPRGLQFVLGTSTKRAVVDTIVMANLGYFQLKATPGAWNLNLRHGRSSEIYEIASHEFTDSPADSQNVVVVINSFKSKIIKVKVNKQKGKEREDLLGESQETGGLWDSISSKLSGGTDKAEEKDQTLNIFSLASGHLYERFLRIMILSVLKHTQSKVKFWFLKNYLSPTFKDFIPHMAKEYNFEYELVQYKWPRWLHQQTEKQRIMWGYKILFLDVLFPLDVQKIIFVDADQIVRTDLQELNDFDLEGAPYGYTPFCNSRTEMDGFRFWKSGYWASHLGSRRYHISALYVVDLKKFRKIAAGDRLRGQYQGLSQDPNSLSNLDQDLPNNMIHQVAIKSLPQEWLWCETWCSDGEKSRAKTIDLCNNPQTKEPKLQAAMRIVPEWKDYDSEVKRLWEIIYKKNGRSEAVNTEPVKDEL